MAEGSRQGELLAGGQAAGSAVINGRCRLQEQDGYRVVSVCGLVLAHYAVGDRIGEAHAMVSLVDQGWAQQNEVARAFGCSERTVRRSQRRFEAQGLAALGRARGYPHGRPRLAGRRRALVERWRSEGVAGREIARRLGVSEKAVRSQLRRLGFAAGVGAGEQLALSTLAGADAKLSALGPVESPVVLDSPRAERSDAVTDTAADADLKLSAATPSLDRDAHDRRFDRTLAALGLLEDAAPLFDGHRRLHGAGVLLAIPALVESGVVEIAGEVYGSLGPAFYGLRTTLITLLLMALLRIKRPEGLKQHAPQTLGSLLGLDRAPEVKTLRKKLARLASFGRAAEFGHALARRRVERHGHALGFLYVDGHVRAYHGKRAIPKAHLARMRLAMPATTDYWVNDTHGEPLFVVTTEANPGLARMLPTVLAEVRTLVGERRLTVVFDRGGYSPKLFEKLVADGFDILTYRKAPVRRLPKRRFSLHEASIEGRQVRYRLADHGVRLRGCRVRLRQVTRLSDDGHQTPILTSRRDLSAVEIAYRMFERWRQENFFKYLRQEYALDALVDYGVEPADAAREVPNPHRRRLAGELRRAYAELQQLVTTYGVEAIFNPETLRRTMRGFKIANAVLARRMRKLAEKIAALENKRARMPARVPVGQVSEGEVIKLAVERKHLTDLIKMVAYQAESDLVRLIAPHYRRAEDEVRTLVRAALATTGDLVVTDTELQISLESLSSPHRTRALNALCEHLNHTRTIFPGSKLRLRFDVKPAPQPSLAFPGPRPQTPANTPEPDKSRRG